MDKKVVELIEALDLAYRKLSMTLRHQGSSN